jgi:hypothetical protein
MRDHRTPRPATRDRVPAAGPAPAAGDDDDFIPYGGPCALPPEVEADMRDRRRGAGCDDAPPDLVAAVMALAGRATTTPRTPRSGRPGRSA